MKVYCTHFFPFFLHHFFSSISQLFGGLWLSCTQIALENKVITQENTFQTKWKLSERALQNGEIAHTHDCWRVMRRCCHFIPGTWYSHTKQNIWGSSTHGVKFNFTPSDTLQLKTTVSNILDGMFCLKIYVNISFLIMHLSNVYVGEKVIIYIPKKERSQKMFKST